MALTGLSGLRAISGLIAGGVTVVTARVAEIGDVDYLTVEITFSAPVESPTADYVSGVTVKVNAVTRVVSSATRQADHRLVHYVIASQADVDDVLTWEYDDDFGDYENETTGDPIADIAATAVTNYIGSHFYFDHEDDALWLGVI